MTLLLTRKRQIGAKIETTEGVLNAPTVAADFRNLIYEPTATNEVRMFERDPARVTLSTLDEIPGIRSGSIRFRTELRGSGVATTAPAWGILLRGCGFREEELGSSNIGPVTGGPFLQGETITGGTSTATGIVHQNTATGAASIRYVRTSVATFTSGEVITGGTSLATATTSSAESPIGFRYRPWSIDPDTATLNGNVLGPASLSLAIMEDGVQKLFKGCRGNANFAMNVGEPGFAEFEFSGVEAGIADVAFVSGVVFDATIPPKFMGTNILTLALDAGTSPFNPLITSFTFNLNSEVAPRENANDASGILSFKIPSRNPSGTLDPEMNLVAEHDWFGKWFAGTGHRLDLVSLGTIAGNRIDVIMEHLLYFNLAEGNRNKIDTNALEFRMHSDSVNSFGDDELFLVCT